VTDSLAPAAVEPLLRGRFGRPYVYAEECESTQVMLAPDAPEGAVAVCEFQSAGRGRLGRSWHAPRGTAIHCSALLRPPGVRAAPELTLVGAITAAEAIEQAAGVPGRIKWPNDVMLDGRKVAGVLGELRDGLVVLGIGINVNQTAKQLPVVARRPPASLRTVTGQAHERGPLLAELLLRLEASYDEWSREGLAAVHHELETRDFLRGLHVEVDGTSGVAAGIDAWGRLLVDSGGERHVVESGEVAYRL
jgi:BirA family biotin operon repressor/biotin-[acetyl-CoA-carboxylase] ligase